MAGGWRSEADRDRALFTRRYELLSAPPPHLRVHEDDRLQAVARDDDGGLRRRAERFAIEDDLGGRHRADVEQTLRRVDGGAALDRLRGACLVHLLRARAMRRAVEWAHGDVDELLAFALPELQREREVVVAGLRRRER